MTVDSEENPETAKAAVDPLFERSSNDKRPFKLQEYKTVCSNSRRVTVKVIAIVGIVSCIILIACVIFITKHQNKASTLPSAPFNHSDPSPFVRTNDSVLIVRSARDLKAQTSKEKVIILCPPPCVTSPPYPYFKGEQVNYLNLDGPLSQNTLHYILSRFSNIEELELNLDLVCSGFQSAPNEEIISANVLLGNLKSLIVRNGIYCPLFSWGFNLEMPLLTNVVVSDFYLSPSNFQSFYSTLFSSQATLRKIVLTHSYICNDETQDICDINKLMFPNLTQLVVTKRIEDESYFTKSLA